MEFAAAAGLFLDDWQAFVFEQALGVLEDGRWASFEVGVDVARQNGKGAILEARELVGIFEWGERLVIHSAHEFPTAQEHFARLLFLVEDTPDLDRQVRKVLRSHAEQGIDLMNGNRIRFRTRTRGGGRGFSADLLALDEAMFLPEFTQGALLPTLSARPNPQVWYTGSAVDQMVHADGVVFARVRERGMAGDDPRLSWFEFSVDADHPDRIDPGVVMSPEAWAAANPGMGIRIDAEHIANEQRSLDPRTFAVERLGVGDWPATTRVGGVIDFEEWRALEDAASKPCDPVCFAVDASPDRARASIAAAGFRDDELAHLEIVDSRQGTGWVVDRLADLQRRHQPLAIVLDARGPAGSLVHEFEEKDVKVAFVGGTEYANACGLIFDLVDQQRLRHLGTSELNAAVRVAQKRDLGDAWAWSRKKSSADISPLVAATLALWGVSSRTQTVYSGRGLVTV